MTRTIFSRLLVIALAGGVASAQAEDAKTDRIVSIGGAVTEILYDLGLKDRIVGVDTTSLFPEEALKQKPNVGYMRALSTEGVLSLKPSLVVAIEGSGPPDALALLRETGLPLAMVQDEQTPQGVLKKITDIGKLVHAEPAAAELSKSVQGHFANLETLRAKVSKPKRVLFVLSLQNGRALVAGQKSAADGMIALAGGINAATGFEGYKAMTDEAIIGAAPDLILMMNTGNHAPAADVFALPAFSATPAAANKALLRMDGLYLLGYGPRTPEAARDLMATLYPELNLPPLGMAR